MIDATRVMVSGGFDPIHVGHIRLLREAALIGHINRLCVALNSDEWLMRKKHYVFMPWEERREILLALECVRFVGKVDDRDDTVCSVLQLWKPHVFCNGGDRTVADPREDAVCQRMGIEQRFNVGGGKVRSSSLLVRAIRDPESHTIPG